MNIKLKSNRISVSELANYSFWIPSYQRPYKWTEEEVKQLLMDIILFSENQNKYKDLLYSLGNIVCVKTSDKDNLPIYEVLDGRQRLTTLKILLFVLDHPLKSEDLFRKEISTFCKNNDIEQCRVVRDFFFRIIKEDVIQIEECVCSRKELKNTINKNVMLNIAEIPIKQYENDYSSNIQKEKSTMFEIINSRGVKLSLLDILKAELIEKLDDELNRFEYWWLNLQKALSERDEKVLETVTFTTSCTSKTYYQSKTLSEIFSSEHEFSDIEMITNHLNNHSEIRPPIDFSNLLVIAREIYKKRKNQNFKDTLDTAYLISRFRDCFNTKESLHKDVWEFMEILRECVEFVVKYCPYRNTDDQFEKPRSHEVDEQVITLIQTFMASNSYINSRQYWLFASILGFIVSKNKSSYLKNDWLSILQLIAWRELTEDTEDDTRKQISQTEALYKLVTEDKKDTFVKRKLNIESLCFSRAGSLPFFICDWLLYRDSQANMECFKQANRHGLIHNDCENKFKDYSSGLNIISRNSKEHWHAQDAIIPIKGDDDGKLLHSFANLAVVDNSLNSALGNKSPIDKANYVIELIKKGSNISPKLYWLALFSKERTESNQYFTNQDLIQMNQWWEDFLRAACDIYLNVQSSKRNS